MITEFMPFQPASPTSSAALSATTTSSQVQLVGPGEQCWIANAGPNNARIRFGGSTVTALTTDQIILANSDRIITLPENFAGYVAGICASSGETASMTFTIGRGN